MSGNAQTHQFPTLANDRGGGELWRAAGPWVTAYADALAGLTAALPAPKAGSAATLDLSAITALDTVGAYLLIRLRDTWSHAGAALTVTGVAPRHAGLLTAVAEAGCPAIPPPEKSHPIEAFVAGIGATVIDAGVVVRELVGFLGMVIIALARTVVQPRRLRGTALLFHIEQTGVAALPILGLLSFLIGVVLAYQSAEQLRRFGADIYVVNLLGVSIMREIGVLLTAIIVAGRSGSAFTAQIGTMKVNQEIDAIETLGLDVAELLVLPRVLALVIVLPLLGFFAIVMGLLGGAVACNVLLDISFPAFLRQLHAATWVPTLVVGLIKTPAFALAISLVGCYEGLKVSGSAESVGALTTKSVVEGIFLVIVLDAAFSVLFALLKV